MENDAAELRALSEAEIEAVSGGIIIVGGLDAAVGVRDALSWVMLNPQPLPPRWAQLNPQPEPPGLALISPQPQPG